MGWSEKVYVIILNWNGWRDTIECLESLFKSDYPRYQIIVCDNNSSDGSLSRIKAWADGQLRAETPSKEEKIRRVISPPVLKPISYVEYQRREAESGGDNKRVTAPLILIQTGDNLGYAGGNNVGLRYALKRGDFKYAWILNNDTIVTPDSLSSMVIQMQNEPKAGICGSKLVYYYNPDTIEAAGGGKYDKWRAQAVHLEAHEPADKPLDENKIVSEMFYVGGASMLVTKRFLDRVGLMNEDYFLYFEELDWAVRSKGQFSLTFAPKSIVYHKQGASTECDSLFSRYLFYRNRLLFTKKYFFWILPFLIAQILAELIYTLLSKKYILSNAIVHALIGISPKKEAHLHQ